MTTTWEFCSFLMTRAREGVMTTWEFFYFLAHLLWQAPLLGGPIWAVARLLPQAEEGVPCWRALKGVCT